MRALPRIWWSCLTRRTAAVANPNPPPASARTHPRPRRHFRRFLPRRLEQFAGAFAASHAQTDHEFVGMGQALRQLHRTAQALATLVREQLAALRDTLHTSRLGGTDGLAARSLHDLQEGLTAAATDLTNLLSVADDLRRLRGDVARIRRVAMFVRTSALGFAVESVRTRESQAQFDSLVGALRGLADRITELADAMETNARQAQSAHETQWRSLSTAHASLAMLARELATAADLSATAAQTLLDHLLEALHHAEARMGQITRRADEAVYYLQFGDIVRQKTEHIGAALREAAGRLRTAARKRDFRARATAVDQSLAVQIAQLDAIQQEVQTAQAKLGHAFHGLREDTAALQSLLDPWHEHPADSPAGTDPLQAFKSDWQHLERLQHRGHELRIGASQTAQQAIAVSSRLSGHLAEVKAVNTEIHFQALNAIVRTASLDQQGATLSVLSMHLDWLYREADALVRAIVGTVETILAKASQASTSRAATAGLAPAPASLDGLDAALAACRQTSLEAHRLMAEQQAALEGSQGFLGYLEAQTPTLEQQIAELVAFRHLLAPWVEGSTASSPASTGSTPDRYTMRSERDIHDRVHRQVTGTRPQDPSPPEPPPPNTPPPPSAPTPATNAVSASDPAALGANVELF
ncbi:MAG: hypothetical protein HS113_28350 [Verrucomicrobiales bacterium]|nr:hypothetical protein [Verrucomicrobiales bacterium]